MALVNKKDYVTPAENKQLKRNERERESERKERENEKREKREKDTELNRY